MGAFPLIATVLTIAGSDPGGGAGIQQDLKTFAALGVWGLSAVTTVTVQDSLGVHDRFDLPPSVVAAQIAVALADAGAAAAKTGVLPSAAIVDAVADSLAAHPLPLVVDPVMVASTGQPLVEEGAIDAMRARLLPLATIATPNAAEVAALTGIEVVDRRSQRDAAVALLASGCRAVVVTGGHLPGDAVVDLFADAGGETEFSALRIPGPTTHGTGCVFSAAVAAFLALGRPALEAARSAGEITARSIAGAQTVGAGAPSAWFRP